METMWAPWRMEYITGPKEPGCIFCKAMTTDDELTLYKGENTMVVMNKFPYINGHILVAPVSHVPSLEQLSSKEMLAVITTVEKSVGILRESMNPDGFNVGLNIGRAAGAGVEEHLHFHIVPRWFGDTNALAVFGEIRVISEHFIATRDRLLPYFKKLPVSF